MTLRFHNQKAVSFLAANAATQTQIMPQSAQVVAAIFLSSVANAVQIISGLRASAKSVARACIGVGGAACAFAGKVARRKRLLGKTCSSWCWQFSRGLVSLFCSQTCSPFCSVHGGDLEVASS